MQRLTIPNHNVVSFRKNAQASRACDMARAASYDRSFGELVGVCHDFFARGGRRRTPKEMACFDAALAAIANSYDRLTVRQLYYQAASVHGIVDKTEQGYKQVASRAVLLRRGWLVNYGRFSDNTRWMMKPETWDVRGLTGRPHLDGMGRFPW